MEIFLGWFIFSIIVGVAASHRGRSGFGWFILATFISPILALILVLVLPNLAPTEAGGRITPETHHRCPECKELIRRDASKCRYCGTKLEPLELDRNWRAQTNLRQARIIFGVFFLMIVLVALMRHVGEQARPSATAPSSASPSPAKLPK